MRLALDDNAAVNPIIAHRQMLDPHGEVVALAGEVDQSGMSLRVIDQELMTRELAAVGFGRGLTLRDIKGPGHVWTGRETSAARPYRTDSRSDDDGIVVEPLSNCGMYRPRSPPSKARTIGAGATTRYVRRMRFEKVWVDQCRATKAIKRRFGAKSALDYLIGETLISSADAARDHPAFARELPKFLAAIWHTFNE